MGRAIPHQWAVVHVFDDIGYVNVCLRATVSSQGTFAIDAPNALWNTLHETVHVVLNRDGNDDYDPGTDWPFAFEFGWTSSDESVVVDPAIDVPTDLGTNDVCDSAF